MITNRSKTIGALAAVLLTLAATHANASVVSFQNPVGAGHFDWGALSPGPDGWLDITAPAASQPPAASGPGVFLHTNASPSFVSGIALTDKVEVEANFNLLAAGLDPGTSIPSGLATLEEGIVFFDSVGSDIQEGVPEYLGVSFDLGGGTQYGWIGVVRTGTDLDPFAWGYETKPGVPIAAGVPEPTTLALFAIAAGSLFIRRRRRFE